MTDPRGQVTFSARVLAPLIAAVEASGHDGRLLLARANVDALVVDDVAARLPRETASAIVEDAVQKTGDPDLGLHAAELIVSTPAEAPRAWSDTLAIAACLGVRRSVAVDGATKAANLGLRFAHRRPTDDDELRRLFDGPLAFDADACAACFRAELLDVPIRTADPALNGVLAPFAPLILEARRVVFGAQDGDVGVVPRVRALREEELEGGNPTTDHVADRMAMSPRTLCRKLSTEGTSFQNVLDGLRRERALALLEDPSVPIADVAGRLGFSSTSAFHHAFRRRTGRPPSDLRSRRSVPPPAKA